MPTGFLAYCANEITQGEIDPFPANYATEVEEARYLAGGAIFKMVGYWKMLLV
jgi:hypothetical protein